MCSLGANDVASRVAFVAPEIVEDDDVSFGQGRSQLLFDIERCVNISPLMGPSMTQGAEMRSQRSAAMNVSVFQWPKGADAVSRCP